MKKPTDVLYVKTKRKIEEFYDVHYFGIDACYRKEAHLRLFDKYYRKEMFSVPNDKIEEYLSNFLEKLHEMVDSMFTD